MTDKQTRFIKEYMIDLNAKQAAIRAGYSAKTAKEQGYRLLKNPNIGARVDEELALSKQRITERNDKYAHELERIAFADISDFIDLATGELKTSPIDISAVATVKSKKIRTKDGEITQYEVKLTGKLKALKKLNKYFERISQVSEATNSSQDTEIKATECPRDINIIDISPYIKPKAVRAPVCPRIQNISNRSEHTTLKNLEEQPYFRCRTYSKPA